MARRRARIFDVLPELRDEVPWIDLGLRESPVHRLAALGASVGHDQLWIKRDDQVSSLYGGNKGRKLAFLLAEALERRSDLVLAVGATGSHQCVATAAFARQVGLPSVAAVAPQPVTPAVRRNLLLDLHFGSEVLYAPDYDALGQRVVERLKAQPRAYLVAPGGSTPTGNLGFVEAAFELAAQVERGAMPAPDRIFLAGASTGSAAGLQLGLALAGLASRVHVVKVSDAQWCTSEILAGHDRALRRLIGEARCPDAPIPQFDPSAFGEGYGVPSIEALSALRALRVEEGVELEACYTAKAFAAMLRFAGSQPAAPPETLLFWHTANGRSFTREIASCDYRALPEALHRVFEEPLPDFGLPPELLAG